MIYWDWSIGVVMGTAVLFYGRGWWRKRPSDSRALLLNIGRGFSFVAAMLLLALALFSPVHAQAVRYFSIHVLQRILLIAVVPFFFFLGNPLPILLAGLPINVQAGVHHFPQFAPRFYRLFVQLTHPVFIWFLFAFTFWLWHDAQINRLMLQIAWVHRLENITLLGTAVFYWWHITAASPRLHRPMAPLWRVAYAALGATPVKLVGLVLMFTSTAVYHYPADISVGNLTITDQSLGAAIVWVVGGIVYTWTAVLLMRTWLQDEDSKPTLPESIWSSEDMMLAPGFGRSSSYSTPPE